METITENKNKEINLSESQLVTFNLSDIEFGVEINKVKEIVRIPGVTKIPNAPTFIEGISNLRGGVLPLINTRIRFGLEPAPITEVTRILVLDVCGSAIGMIVDSVKEVLRVDNSIIEKAPKVVKGIQSDFLEGVIKLNKGERLILTINVEKSCMLESEVKVKESKEFAAVKMAEHKIKEEKIEEELIVTFLLEKEEFGFFVDSVNEIIRVPEITKVPGAPNYVNGIISLRNEILPVVDLRVFLGLATKEYSDSTRIIVFTINNVKIGLIVDKVNEVIRITKSIIEPPPAILSGRERKQLKGLAKLKEGKRIIMIFDSQNLFEEAEISEMGKIVESNVKENEKVKEEISGMIEEEQLVTFRLANEEYGINIKQVQEINRMQSIVHVPNAPSFIEGVANLRGNVIPVISLRKRFSIGKKEFDDKTRLVIVEIQNNKTALIVDSVSEVLRVPKKDIEPAPAIISSAIEREFIGGICKLQQGKRMIILLNLDKLLTETEKKELSLLDEIEKELQEKDGDLLKKENKKKEKKVK
ncbi:MAG TPA: chemotaxis protein CheW [bacterium]|nr:chemotaxis protein CheW [bacterium]HOL48164.1 chemotaxis protein CheW [bacterium]HPQ17765.1 chemotaxis protein CheW [bacterium]